MFVRPSVFALFLFARILFDRAARRKEPTPEDAADAPGQKSKKDLKEATGEFLFLAIE